MADFLGGLLSGGGGLYDDLLTPQQRDQLSSRGLLSMAGAFADAAMPSRFPVPLGAAIGKAAAAMSGGRDEAALRLLQGQKLSQEVQTMKATSALQQQFMKDIQTLPLDALFKRYNIGTGGGAPAAAGPTVMPGAAPAVPARPAAPPTTAPLPPAAAALPAEPSEQSAAALFGGDSAAGEYGVGQYDVGQGIPPPPTGLLGPAPSLPPGDVPPTEPPLKASSLGAPDTVLPSGPGGLLATPAMYGGGAGTPPFGPGGEAAPTVRLAASSGDPRGLIPYIRERAIANGIDPDVAVRVAQSEGLGTFQSSVIQRDGRREPSYGAMQLYTGGGMGNDFQRDTGLDPSDPKNERATIDYALSKAPSTGWTPWHGAAGAGIGPRTGLPGGPDYVVPAGRGVPGFTRAQYSGAAPGASGAPATAAAGGDGQGMNTLLLELAKRNAMAEILKLGNPYSSMLSVLQGSPAYQGEIEAAKREAGIPFIAREKTEERRVTEPSDIRIAQAKTAADMAKDMALQGFMLDPDTNKVVPVPGYWDMMKGREDDKQRLQAEWQAKFKPVDATVWLPDGSKGTQKMTEYEFQQRQAATAKRASMGAAPQPGDIAAMPTLDPRQLKGLDTQTKILEEKRGLASTARGQIQNFNDQRRQIEQGVIAGQFAEGRTGWAKIGQVLGLTGETQDQLIANTETYVANLGKNLKEGLAGLGPPISNSDIAIAERITGSQQMTVKGALQLMELREKYARLALKEYNDRVKATPDSGHQHIPEPPTYGARQFRDPRTGDVFWENKETGQWQSATTGTPYGG